MVENFYDGHDELYHRAKFGEDCTTRAVCRCGNMAFVPFTGRIAAKRQTADIKFTHRPKIRFFSPHRGDSLHRFTSNLARPTGTWLRLAVQQCTSIGAGANMAPKYQKFPLFNKESRRRSEPLDRFLKFLGAFIRRTILH